MENRVGAVRAVAAALEIPGTAGKTFELLEGGTPIREALKGM